MRQRIYEILEVAGPDDRTSRWVDLAIMSLVLANVLAVMLESIPHFQLAHQSFFIAFEEVSVALFTLEFFARIWANADAPASGTQTGPDDSEVARRLRYLRSPSAVCDLLAIAPFYLTAFTTLDLRFLRVLRLLRIVKLTRYSVALSRIVEVYRLQRNALAASFFILSVAIVLSASVLYVIEHAAQPEAFGSIPAAMWWAVCTLTTVGYGDVTPITPIGKLVASGITLIGVAMVALPTSLFASGFSHIMQRNEQALEKQAREALADGVMDAEEQAAYQRLAEQLEVEPELAREVVESMMRERAWLDADCPHCGKEIR